MIGAPITPIKLDVTNEDGIGATAKLGFVDILVNNAGVAGYGNPVSMNFEDAMSEMSVNYFGALRMVRALAPAMIERGEGMIVNIATAFAKVNLPLVGTYCASKAALIEFTEVAAVELKEHGIRVNCVSPGSVDTAMWAVASASPGTGRGPRGT